MTQPKRKPRITQRQYDRRIEELHRLIMYGYSHAQIMERCTDGWNLSKRQARRYIAAAYDTFNATAGIDPETHLGIALERLNDLFNTANRAGNVPLALTVQLEINHLLHYVKPRPDNAARLKRALKNVSAELDAQTSIEYKDPVSLRDDIADGYKTIIDE